MAPYTQSYLGGTINAFMGYDGPKYGPGMESPGALMAEMTRIQTATDALKDFTDAKIQADMAALSNHPNVLTLQKLIAQDKAAGTYDASMEHFINGLRATEKLLKSNLKTGTMTDRVTQRIVDTLGLAALYFDTIESEFGGMIPTVYANEAKQLDQSIRELKDQLVALRAKQYAQSRVDASQASADLAQWEQWQQSQGQEQSEQDANEIVPSQSDLIVPTGATEKTTMQKVAPVLALAAGGVAAYFALR